MKEPIFTAVAILSACFLLTVLYYLGANLGR